MHHPIWYQESLTLAKEVDVRKASKENTEPSRTETTMTKGLGKNIRNLSQLHSWTI